MRGYRRILTKCPRPCNVCWNHPRPNGRFARVSISRRIISIGDDNKPNRRHSRSLRTRLGKSDHQEITSSGWKSLFNKLQFLGGRFWVSALQKMLQQWRITEVKAGIYAFEFSCKKCHAKSTRVSDSRIIESKFRPKSWLPNYVLMSFLLNGEYYKDYEHVLGTLGIGHLSKTQWQRVVKWVHPFVKQLANWSCSEVKQQIIRRGDQKNLKIVFDGFYLTRGFHANNANGTIHDEQTA